MDVIYGTVSTLLPGCLVQGVVSECRFV